MSEVILGKSSTPLCCQLISVHGFLIILLSRSPTVVHFSKAGLGLSMPLLGRPLLGCHPVSVSRLLSDDGNARPSVGTC